jgi:hypothetical protein
MNLTHVFKEEICPVDISIKPMGLGPFVASAPLFERNGELLGHSPIHHLSFSLNIA